MTKGSKIDKQDGAYFMTFTVVDWVKVFMEDKYKLILCDSLNFYTGGKSAVNVSLINLQNLY